MVLKAPKPSGVCPQNVTRQCLEVAADKNVRAPASTPAGIGREARFSGLTWSPFPGALELLSGRPGKPFGGFVEFAQDLLCSFACRAPPGGNERVALIGIHEPCGGQQLGLIL